MRLTFPKETAAVLLLACAVALPLAIGGVYVYQKHQWAEARMAELAPRHARLLGIEAQRDNLAQAQAAAQERLALYIYPADQDANTTGNEVQQRVRSLLTAAGLQIASSQVLPLKEEKSFERIPLSVRAEGEMLAVQGALAGLAEQKPAILVDAMVVQGYGAPVNGVQRLSVQLSLSVLRSRS
ncbi:MAG: type II secretion system protein GspM [Burkholderiaceae bacterium]|nr:type II secretion system protein GspM [Burkholderiaceae bacterium]